MKKALLWSLLLSVTILAKYNQNYPLYTLEKVLFTEVSDASIFSIEAVDSSLHLRKRNIKTGDLEGKFDFTLPAPHITSFDLSQNKKELWYTTEKAIYIIKIRNGSHRRFMQLPSKLQNPLRIWSMKDALILESKSGVLYVINTKSFVVSPLFRKSFSSLRFIDKERDLVVYSRDEDEEHNTLYSQSPLKPKSAQKIGHYKAGSSLTSRFTNILFSQIPQFSFDSAAIYLPLSDEFNWIHASEQANRYPCELKHMESTPAILDTIKALYQWHKGKLYSVEKGGYLFSKTGGLGDEGTLRVYSIREPLITPPVLTTPENQELLEDYLHKRVEKERWALPSERVKKLFSASLFGIELKIFDPGCCWKAGSSLAYERDGSYYLLESGEDFMNLIGETFTLNDATAQEFLAACNELMPSDSPFEGEFTEIKREGKSWIFLRDRVMDKEGIHLITDETGRILSIDQEYYEDKEEQSSNKQ